MRYASLCLVLLLVACQSGPPSQSGFLKDYSKLEQVGKRPHAWVWEKPGVDMRVYDRLMFDPVEVKLLEGIDWRLDKLEASDRGHDLRAPVLLLTLRYREGRKSERVTLQLLPDTIRKLKRVCERFVE